MASWTVLTKDVAGDTPLRAAERVVFVREAFSWMALIFAPLVLLRYRLWLAFIGYLVVSVLLAVAGLRFGLPDTVSTAVEVGIHMLIALELPSLRIAKLRWRGFEEAGSLVARDQMEAELRFFAQGWPLAAPAPARSQRPQTPRSTAGGAPTVIGSFPEPYAP
ncbi:DUF2628 domain-containing protein [Azorhizobium sp. AG788]|uniref:DUF2628 domain-containing protein n=1 Tax=Azorhizobium sp. AG788 TaxID=2183897 RepID=UPI003138ECD8